MAVEQLSADAFEDLIKDKKVQLIDVRELFEFKQGHIKGAKLLPATRFSEKFEENKIKKSDKIAIYCQNGNRSDFLAQKLTQQGFEKVFNLEMGLIEWLDYNKKIV